MMIFKDIYRRVVCCFIGAAKWGIVLAACAGETPLLAQVPLRVAVSELNAQPAGRAYGERLLTVSEAVRLTLLRNPEIWASQQDLLFALGQLEEARGNFDPVFSVSPGFSQTQTQLDPSFRAYESGKRLQLQSLATGFEQLNREFRRQFSAMVLRVPTCPPAFDFGGAGVIEERPGAVGLDADAVCAPARASQIGPRRHRLSADLGVASGGGRSRSKAYERRTQSSASDLDDAIALSQALFDRARLAFDRLGPVPSQRIVRSLSFSAGISKTLRNGLSFDGNFQLQSTEQVFQGKPKDPRFGGVEISDQFTSVASMTVNVPLAKGRGRVSAGAPERFAELASRAQREQLRHVMNEQVFRTVLAYFNLVAAQDTLTLLEESLVRQEVLVDLTEQLFAAGDATLVEIGRVNARAAQRRGEVFDEELSVLAARIGLAQVIGLELNSLAEAPLAAETFAEFSQNLMRFTVSGNDAVSARRDLKAVRYLRNASRVFAAAAESDVKRRVDLSTSVGMSSLYQSPFFLSDMAGQAPTGTELVSTLSTNDSPTHYYSPSGFARVFGGGWNPFASVSLTFELPFSNNKARGLATQARASREKSEIDTTNLERSIREALADVSEQLEHSTQMVEQGQRGVNLYRQTLEDALQLFEGGEFTLVDTLLSEEDLTVEQLSLVRSQQYTSSLVARLKFEGGGLVGFEAEGTDAELVVFEPFGLLTSE